MIKKFSEFIEEGFMTRSLDRRKDKSSRLEDFDILKDSDKIIDFFLKKNEYDSMSDFERQHPKFIKNLKVQKYFSEKECKIIMIIIGKIMMLYPEFDLRGYFTVCPNFMLYTFKNMDSKKLKFDKDGLYKIFWVTKEKGNGLSDDKFTFAHEMDGDCEFTEPEIYQAINYMIETSKEYFNK